jgi:tRNA nucleotidyltransferase (CCA-adding enzyme)
VHRREDLAARRVRFVGSPERRIQEDYLRILRYFRFYGRIVPEPDQHCEATLAAVRANAGGLARVSGERIWAEWAKVLAGPHGGPLTAAMVEAGLGPHIGLPAAPDLEALDRVWRQGEARGERLEPMALLVALLASEEEVLALHGRLKLSSVERDLGLFVAQRRGVAGEGLRPWQWIAVDSKARQQDTRLFVGQALRYRGDWGLAQQFAEWEMPRCCPRVCFL